MAFNWFLMIGKGRAPVFRKRAKPVPQVIQLLPMQLEGEEIRKGNEAAKRQLGDLTSQVKKLGSRQDEMALAVEELTEGLQVQKDAVSDQLREKEKEINGLLSAMITAADYTEDFYYYAKESGNQGVYEQACFFWNALNKKYGAVGLVRINDENTMADAVYNHISDAEFSDEITKPGVIIRTVRSGYIYNGQVIRKSEVVVSKPKGDEPLNDSWH